MTGDEASAPENISTSELRLKLIEVARRVERQKARIIIRRRFDAVAFMVPMEDYKRADLPQPAEVIRSVRDARDGIAGYIDRLIDGNVSFVIQQRGEPVAALLPVSAMPSLFADIQRAERDAHGNVVPTLSRVSASTAPITSERPEPTSEIIVAAELQDQAGRKCLSDGIIILLAEGDRKFLSGVIKPDVPADKLMIKVKDSFLSNFRPASNRPEYFGFGPMEVEASATPSDVQLMRLA